MAKYYTESLSARFEDAGKAYQDMEWYLQDKGLVQFGIPVGNEGYYHSNIASVVLGLHGPRHTVTAYVCTSRPAFIDDLVANFPPLKSWNNRQEIESKD